MKKWIKYMRPYWKFFLLGPLCIILEACGEVVMPKFMAAIIDNGIATGRVSYIMGIMIAMVCTALCMMAGGLGGAFFGSRASVGFASDIRADVFRNIQRFSFANIDKFSTGSLITRLTNDVTQLQNFVFMVLLMCMRAPSMLIGGLIMAISINPGLARVLLVTIPLMFVFLIVIMRIGFSRFGIMQEKIDKLNNNVQENLTNVRVIKSFVREKHQNKLFTEANQDLRRSGIRASSVMIFMNPVMSFFMNVSTIAVIYFGGKEILTLTEAKAGMSIGDLTAFIGYISQVLGSFMMIIMMFMSSSRAFASAKRIREVLEETPDITDEMATKKDKIVENGSIEFRDVSFRYYKNSPDTVLSGINLSINSGETVGIIGSTGCGKTTLVSLLPRLYDVDEGSVFVDGVDVRNYSLENLRQGIGIVLQKNVLFSGSIEDNLRWGDEEADMNALRAAADSAQADQFVEGFTDGYETVLGQGGVNLSGGQKQRLCIARALLKKPKILILDDSTSAVDTATEAKIRATFRNELKDTTKIIIAQRISSVMDADKIVVMNDGKIVGVGTHEELLQSCEDYREICASQLEKKEVES